MPLHHTFPFHIDSVTKTSTPSFNKNGKAAGPQGTPWETLVVFAINLKQLNVQMNMSNVMGNNTYVFLLPLPLNTLYSTH